MGRFINRKGQSTGFAFIIGIIFLFVLGLAYVIFNQVMTVHIQPISDNLINSSEHLNVTDANDLQANNDKYMSFWNSMPFIIVFLIVIYLLTSGFRKGDDRYG